MSIIAGEGQEIAADATRVAFDPARINVYVDEWCVAPIATQGKAA